MFEHEEEESSDEESKQVPDQEIPLVSYSSSLKKERFDVGSDLSQEREQRVQEPKEKFKSIVEEFDEMITFMDYSFEKAFEKKEKDFILAYRGHIDRVQEELIQLKAESSDQRFLQVKQQKVHQLENKLRRIRECALFLGDMSEMHRKAIKEVKMKVGEQEQDKQFLEKQIEKVRGKNKMLKDDLSRTCEEYDQLFIQAQEFIKTTNDKDKIKEMLSLLDAKQREQILQQQREKHLFQQEELSKKKPQEPANTQNQKLSNFIQTLFEMKVPRS